MSHSTIRKSAVEDVIGLTPMQEGMLFHYLQDPKAGLYVEQFTYTLEGKLDLSACLDAWNWTICHNEMLRTVFRWENINHPVQVVLKERLLSYALHDLSLFGTEEKIEAMQQIQDVDRNEWFDLAEGPLFRVALLKLEETRYVMMVTNHHILFDGWSNGIILGEFLQAYAAFKNNGDPEATTKPRFKEYVKWLNDQCISKHSRDFWRNYLEGYSFEPIFLSEDSLDRKVDTINHSYLLPEKLNQDLENVAQNVGVTMGTIFTSAWGILLQKYTNRHDVVFGTTVSGRSSHLSEIERVVGLLINTVPMRIKTGAGTTIKDTLLDVQQEGLVRQPYETTPLVDIQSSVGVQRTEKLFDTLCVIENYPLNHIQMDGLKLESLEGYSVTNYSLILSINRFEQTTINFTYQKPKIETSTIDLLWERYVALLKLMVSNRERVVEDIHYLTEIEEELAKIWDIDFDYTN